MRKVAVLHCHTRSRTNPSQISATENYDLFDESDRSCGQGAFVYSVSSEVAIEGLKLRHPAWGRRHVLEFPRFYATFAEVERDGGRKLQIKLIENQVLLNDSAATEYRSCGIPEALLAFVYETHALPNSIPLVSSRKNPSFAERVVPSEERTDDADKMWKWLEGLGLARYDEVIDTWFYAPPPDLAGTYTLAAD